MNLCGKLSGRKFPSSWPPMLIQMYITMYKHNQIKQSNQRGQMSYIWRDGTWRHDGPVRWRQMSRLSSVTSWVVRFSVRPPAESLPTAFPETNEAGFQLSCFSRLCTNSLELCMTALTSYSAADREAAEYCDWWACLCVCVVCPRSYLRNCTSGFTKFLFSHKSRSIDVAAQLKCSAHAALGLAINCAQ